MARDPQLDKILREKHVEHNRMVDCAADAARMQEYLNAAPSELSYAEMRYAITQSASHSN